jgi:hypothetical protein
LFPCIQSNPKKISKHISHVLKIQKINIVTSLWLSIKIWLKYQKSFTNHFVHFILWFRCRL